MDFIRFLTAVCYLDAKIIVNMRLHSSDFLTNKNTILQRNVTALQFTYEVINRVLRGRNVHGESGVDFFIFGSYESAGAERLVIDYDTHLRMLQANRTVDVGRIVDVTQQETIALHWHSTWVRKHFIVVKQRILIVDVDAEIVTEIQRLLATVFEGCDGDMTIHKSV